MANELTNIIQLEIDSLTTVYFSFPNLNLHFENVPVGTIPLQLITSINKEKGWAEI